MRIDSVAEWTAIRQFMSHSGSNWKNKSFIEVDPLNRRLREARGKLNVQPEAAAREVMEKWPQQEQLVWDDA